MAPVHATTVKMGRPVLIATIHTLATVPQGILGVLIINTAIPYLLKAKVKVLVLVNPVQMGKSAAEQVTSLNVSVQQVKCIVKSMSTASPFPQWASVILGAHVRCALWVKSATPPLMPSVAILSLGATVLARHLCFVKDTVAWILEMICLVVPVI